MNHTITLAAAGTYDIDTHGHAVAAIILENSGGADLYWGDRPEAARTLAAADMTGPLNGGDATSITSGSPVISFGRDVPPWVLQGMGLSGSGVPGGATVLAVSNNKLTMSANATESDADIDFTITPPALSETTGITLVPGGIERFTSDYGTRFLQQGIRLYSVAGTTVKIMKRFT